MSDRLARDTTSKMNLFFNILTVIFIFLQIFSAQNNDMIVQATITSVYVNDTNYFRKASCTDGKIVSGTSEEYFIYVYMESKSFDPKKQNFILFRSKFNCSTEYKQPSNTVSVDYNANEKYIELKHKLCLHKSKETNECGSYEKIIEISSKTSFDYLFDSFFDTKNKVSVYGTIKVINKIIQMPYRSCIAITELFHARESEFSKSQYELESFKQNLEANDGIEKTKEEYITLNNINHIKFMSSGLCDSIHKNNSKLSIELSNKDYKHGKIFIPWTFDGTFNNRMYYSFNHSEVGTYVKGYFEAKTTYTVIGMEKACKYKSPISCSDGTTTHCFIKRYSQQECIPAEERPNCNLTCENGGKCVISYKTIGCMCAEGYYGETCDKKDCEGGCDNGECTESGECSCHPGWSGSNCSIRNCSEDICNRDECTMNGNEYECKCNSLNSTGSNCEFKCDPECTDGECTLIGGSTTCMCRTGKGMSLCIEEVNSSSSNNVVSEEVNSSSSNNAASDIKKSNIKYPRARIIIIFCFASVFVTIIAIPVIIHVKKFFIGKTMLANVQKIVKKYVAESQSELNIYEKQSRNSGTVVYGNENETYLTFDNDNIMDDHLYEEPNMDQYIEPLYDLYDIRNENSSKDTPEAPIDDTYD